MRRTNTSIVYRLFLSPGASSTDKLYPSEAYISFKGKRSKAMADQLTTVSKKRLIGNAGAVSGKDMQNIEVAVKTHLDLP